MNPISLIKLLALSNKEMVMELMLLPNWLEKTFGDAKGAGVFSTCVLDVIEMVCIYATGKADNNRSENKNIRSDRSL